MKRGWSFALLLALPGTVRAQAADPIIVTAPGGDIDGDEARTLDAAAIRAAGRADVARALERGVPGLSLAEAAGNPWQASIGWRGYSVSALQGAEQGLAVYLDGARFNQPFGDTVLMDLLPEAALVNVRLNEANPVLGRNALAGSLALETGTGFSLPGLRIEADLDTVGSPGGAVSWGTGNGARSLLLVAEARKDRGWREASPSRLYRGFAKGRIAQGSWGVELSALGAVTDLTGNGVAPVQLLDADWSAVFTRPDRTRTRFGRAMIVPWLETGETGKVELRLYAQSLTRRSANGDLADFGACDDDPARLCLGSEDEGFADPLLSNGAPVLSDPGVEDYAAFNRGRERTRSGGASLQWLDERETAVGTRRIAIGASWETARTRFHASSELGVLEDDRSVVGLGSVLSSADGTVAPVELVSRMEDVALFASAAVPLTHRLGIEAGLRWAHNRVTLADELGTALNGRHRFTSFDPSLELDYAVSGTLRLSAGYARTSRIPTPAELSCADPEAPCTLANFFIADPPLKAVRAGSWHLGVAGEADGLHWRTTLWRSDTKNDIRMIASSVRGRGYFANLGQSRRQGLEASVEWSNRDANGRGWTASGSYAFTDARFRQGFAISSPANPAADEDGLIAVSRGDAMPGVPRHAANLLLGYAGAGWQLGATMRARSGQVLLGDEGNDNPKTPAYALFDLNGEISLGHGLTLAAELRNLFDRRYATSGTFAEIDDIRLEEAPGADDPRAYAPGAPRRLIVTLRAQLP